MKYNDLSDVETEITRNDYVTYDVKPRHSPKGFANRLKSKKLLQNKSNLFVIPLLVLTAVSLGFLIAQLAEMAALSAASSILSSVL